MPVVLRNKDTHLEIGSYDLSDSIDHVPPYVYRLSLTQDGPVLIKDRAGFDIPSKYYGKLGQYRDTIIESFKHREQPTGAIFVGAKGTGKTALSEGIANKMLGMDIPVIMVTSAMPGQIISSIAQIAQPCMFLFDEFEKVYDEQGQEGLLPVFSDASLKQVMFVLTGNDDNKVNPNLFNRPGRLLYGIHFDNLDHEVANELINEYDLSVEVRDALMSWVLQKSASMSFDLLKSTLEMIKGVTTVKEMIERMSILNVPDMATRLFYISAIEKNIQGVPYCAYTDREYHVELLDNVLTVSFRDVEGRYHEGYWDIYDRSAVKSLRSLGTPEHVKDYASEVQLTAPDPIMALKNCVVHFTNGITVTMNAEQSSMYFMSSERFGVNLFFVGHVTTNEAGESDEGTTKEGKSDSEVKPNVVMHECDKSRVDGSLDEGESVVVWPITTSEGMGTAKIPLHSTYGAHGEVGSQGRDAISRRLGLPPQVWGGENDSN